jgi:deazaflavin-dependent oxidoreductase (nitroreductase family)
LLYAIGAGRLLGHRFLLLTHRGRRSGRLYRTVLEVVAWDADSREAIVMSGFGHRSGWLLNALAGGAEEVQVGGSAFRPKVRELGLDEAARVLAAYDRRNRLLAPFARRVLSRLAGFRYDGSDGARRELVARLPMIGFRDVSPGSTANRP